MADPTPANPDFFKALADRFTKLEGAVADLSSASAAQRNQTSANMVSPAAASNENTTSSFTTASAAYATVTFTVPTGYTRAVVYGTSTASLLSNSGTSTALLQVWCFINGVGGPQAWAQTQGQQYAGAAAAFASVLTGLTAGATFTVATWVAFPVAHTLPRSAVSASALFLR